MTTADGSATSMVHTLRITERLYISTARYAKVTLSCGITPRYKVPGHGPGRSQSQEIPGVLRNRAFQAPGKFYFKVRIMYNMVRSLDNIHFVFEVGVSRRCDVDHNYYIYDQPSAWSFCGQHCDDHKQVCAWCRHHGYNLAHMPLSLNTAGTVIDRKFGFLLDSDRRQLTVFDVTRNRKVHSFTDVDFSSSLWPVFGCH